MKKTKILALLIIITLLLSLVPPIASNVWADTNAVVKLVNSDGEGKQILVAPGDTFSIDMYYTKGSKQAGSLSGAIHFDSDKLEIVNKKAIGSDSYNITQDSNIVDSIADQRLISNNFVKTPNDIVFLFNDSNTELKSGKAMRITFRVKEGATGSFNFALNKIKHYEDGFAETSVDVPITVASSISGTIKTPLKAISLNKTSATVGINETEKLTVSYNPVDTTDSKNIAWSSSNKNIATVDSNGNVKGIAPGTATITATSNISGVKPATCQVSVTSKLQSISLNKTSMELSKTQTEKLRVTYNPSNTTDSKNITWSSSNKDVATVDQEGNVTAIANGTTTITATSNVSGVKPATCEVSVTSKLQSISLDESKFELNKTASKVLTVKYFPEDTTDSKNVIWQSSDTNVATVDNTGKITAIKPGTATITANCNGKIATAVVTVKSPLTSIKITGDQELLPGQNETLNVIYTPEDTTDSRTILWSTSDSSIVTVDSTGKVTAVKPGTATVTAKCGNIEKQILITVKEVHTEKIAFERENVKLNKNEKTTAKILYYPENTTDNKTVIWTSENENIATVENGVITAKAAGTTRIKAQVGEKVAYCSVSVEVPLTGISLDKNVVDLIKGDNTKLVISYNENDTTDDKTVSWSSSNINIATVDNNGVVTAKTAGTAIIKAQVGNYTATCKVNVKVPLTGISVKTSTTLVKNQTEILNVVYTPEDTTDDKTVTWSSEDTSIATVDNTGKVKALKEGTVNIIATVGEFEAKCAVTVKEIKLEGIAISNKKDTLLEGEENKLEIVYTPENTTDIKKVEWLSSDEAIATVDENGNVKALKAGTTIITAISGEFKDSYTLTVKENTNKIDKDEKTDNTTDNEKTTETVDQKEQTTQVDSKETKTTKKVASPKTGDINIALYLILMITSLCGICKYIKNRK